MADQNVSRRSLAKGAAWSVPAVALASSAPAMAASQACVYTVQWAPNSTPGAQSMLATSPSTGRVLRVTMTSTQTTMVGSPSNMTVGTAIHQFATCSSAGTAFPTATGTGFSAIGLVLQQVGQRNNGCSASGLFTPSQTVTFSFTDNATGQAVKTAGGTMRITDISSHDPSNYIQKYWDEVRFDKSATSVTGVNLGAAPVPLNTTSGTTFRPSSGTATTVRWWAHDFNFDSFPTQVTYTNYGRTGGQYIQISGITFTAPC